MVVVGGRDVARNVCTTGVEPGQQQRQRTVGLLPHQAVDGLQFWGNGGLWRRKILRLYGIVLFWVAGSQD